MRAVGENSSDEETFIHIYYIDIMCMCEFSY
jgi:hypothetical protein